MELYLVKRRRNFIPRVTFHHSLNISKTTTNIERMVERDKWDKIPPPFDKIELRRLVWVSFWPAKSRNCYSIQDKKKFLFIYYVRKKNAFVRGQCSQFS